MKRKRSKHYRRGKPTEDLGNVSSKDLAAKEKEVDQLQKNKPKDCPTSS